jgi:hypothetical protein
MSITTFPSKRWRLLSMAARYDPVRTSSLSISSWMAKCLRKTGLLNPEQAGRQQSSHPISLTLPTDDAPVRIEVVVFRRGLRGLGLALHDSLTPRLALLCEIADVRFSCAPKPWIGLYETANFHMIIVATLSRRPIRTRAMAPPTLWWWGFGTNSVGLQYTHRYYSL